LPTTSIVLRFHEPRPLLLAATLLLTVALPLAARAAQPATNVTGGHLVHTDLRVTGARLHVTLDADQYRIGPDELTEWVRRSASIVADYYGTFPTATVEVSVKAVDGGGVHGGRAFAQPAARIRINVGRAVSRRELLEDWVLVHEMIHLALPDVGETHAWLAEGLATYVEGVARVQAGNLDARELWREDVAAMPKGMPAPGDAGLDHTHTWGRTYWGGALFCLAADVTIRERSGNRRGLQDALRAVMRASGGMTASWPIERVFSTADAATGTTVLSEIYAAMRDAPAAPDLVDLWRRLGVHVENGVMQLETGTGSAEIRDAIVRRPAG
jgi:hypothetical protein